MVIKYFAFTLFILSIGAYFIPIEDAKKNIIDNNAPIVIFETPVMYTLNEDGIKRAIKIGALLSAFDFVHLLKINYVARNLNKKVKVHLEKQFPDTTKVKFEVSAPLFDDLLKVEILKSPLP